MAHLCGFHILLFALMYCFPESHIWSTLTSFGMSCCGLSLLAVLQDLFQTYNYRAPHSAPLSPLLEWVTEMGRAGEMLEAFACLACLFGEVPVVKFNWNQGICGLFQDNYKVSCITSCNVSQRGCEGMLAGWACGFVSGGCGYHIKWKHWPRTRDCTKYRSAALRKLILPEGLSLIPRHINFCRFLWTFLYVIQYLKYNGNLK